MILGGFRRFAEFFWIETFHHLRSELSPHQHPSREKSKYPGPLQLGIAILYNGLLSQHLSTTDTLPMGEPFNSPKVNLGAPSDSKKNYNPAFCSQCDCEMFLLPNKGKKVNKRHQKQRNERVTCCIISLRLCWTCLKAGNWAKMGDVADATQLQ